MTIGLESKVPGRTIFKHLNKCFHFSLALIFNANTTTNIKKHIFLTKKHFVVQVFNTPFEKITPLKNINHLG